MITETSYGSDQSESRLFFSAHVLISEGKFTLKILVTRNCGIQSSGQTRRPKQSWLKVMERQNVSLVVGLLKVCDNLEGKRGTSSIRGFHESVSHNYRSMIV